MKIKIIWVGKTASEYQALVDHYLKRIQHFHKEMETILIKDAGIAQEKEGKTKEAQGILSVLDPKDFVVLLDEKGKNFSSLGFADFLQQKKIANTKQIVFIVGGAFGFDPKIYEIAQEKIALSQMTFTHQMVRIFLLEQIYRAFSILEGSKYHH